MRAYRVISFVLVAMLVTAGCADDRDQAPESAGSDRGGSGRIGTIELDSVATIGVLDGEPELVFGRIADVEVDGTGRIYVLDAQTPAVRVFDAEGRHVMSLTARGEGPGELLGPVAIALDAEDALRVLDPRNGRIDEFRFAGGVLSYVRSIRPAVVGAELCRIGDRWYTQRIAGESMFHVLEDEGTVVASFGEPLDISAYVAGPVGGMIRETLVMGPLACAEEGAAIVSMATALPRVRAFEASGEPQWEIELADYVPLRIAATGRGISSEPAEGMGSHVALGLVPWSPEVVLVQLEIRRRQNAADPPPVRVIESRFVSLATGEELHRTRELPRILAVDGRTVYAVREEPYPQLRILRLAGEP